MTTTTDTCAFCGKGRSEVKHLVSAGRASICDECVGLGGKIIAAREQEPAAAPAPTPQAPAPKATPGVTLAPTPAEIDAFLAKVKAEPGTGARIARATFELYDLSGYDFTGVWFDHCVFRSANFKKATLRGATFDCCDMIGTKLVECNAVGADFSGSHFGKAALSGSNFEDASFARCDFSGAMVACCRFVGACMDDTKWEASEVTSNWISAGALDEIRASIADQRMVDDVIKGFAVERTELKPSAIAVTTPNGVEVVPVLAPAAKVPLPLSSLTCLVCGAAITGERDTYYDLNGVAKCLKCGGFKR